MMKKIAVLMLVLVLALCAVGCADVGVNGGDTNDKRAVADGETIGTGATSFTVEVVDLKGKSVKFTVKTDKKTVGEALQELGVLEGEEGPYGLYMKAVNGIALDYDKDGAYWAFYVNGAYANEGVDMTAIDTSVVYKLQAEKG